MEKNLTIEELERLLNTEEDANIQILPNGQIMQVGKATEKEMGSKKPITFRENLGGEYATGSCRV